MGKASPEARERWKAKAYKRYDLCLRHDRDEEIIEFLEANKARYGISGIVRDALEMYMKSGALD